MLCLPSDDDRKWDGGEEDGMAKGEGETMKLHGGTGSTNEMRHSRRFHRG